MVTKDMTEYTHVLKSWDIDENLDVLLEVANLFVIGPEALRERIRSKATAASSAANGGRKASAATDYDAENGLSVQEVKAYVSRREDCNTPAMQSVITSL